MAPRRPRVLFLCHSASRNGATILLAHSLQWLKDHADWDTELVVQGAGPLLDDLRGAVRKTTVWRDPGAALEVLCGRSRNRLRCSLEHGLARLALPRGSFDLIYANTSATAPLVRLLAGRTRAVLWHVHELTYALNWTLRDAGLAAVFGTATRFVAVSEAVRQALRSGFGLPSERIDVVNGFVPPVLAAPMDGARRSQRAREDLGLPQDAFVVGGCGSLGWRKGTDLFLQVARVVMSRTGYEDVRFMWIGGSRGEKESLEFEHDLRLLGLQGRCRWVPGTASVQDHFRALNVFALTSREDPFPLVMLEAAEQCLPVVCFEGAGGGTEFVGTDCGIAVPYLDVEAFAAAIMRLYDEAQRRLYLGRRGQQKVREFHRVEIQGPRLLEAARSCMDRTSGAVR